MINEEVKESVKVEKDTVTIQSDKIRSTIDEIKPAEQIIASVSKSLIKKLGSKDEPVNKSLAHLNDSINAQTEPPKLDETITSAKTEKPSENKKDLTTTDAKSVNIRANDLGEKVSSSVEAKVRVKSPSPVQNLAAEVKEADVGLEESPEGRKDEEKPKPFTKVQVRVPTPTRVEDTPKITTPQESTRTVGLKKQIKDLKKMAESAVLDKPDQAAEQLSSVDKISAGEKTTMDAKIEAKIDPSSIQTSDLS